MHNCSYGTRGRHQSSNIPSRTGMISLLLITWVFLTNFVYELHQAWELFLIIHQRWEFKIKLLFIVPNDLFKVRDAGNLLTRAGFSLPGIDVDEYTVRYGSGEHLYILHAEFYFTICRHRWKFNMVYDKSFVLGYIHRE